MQDCDIISGTFYDICISRNYRKPSKLSFGSPSGQLYFPTLCYSISGRFKRKIFTHPLFVTIHFIPAALAAARPMALSSTTTQLKIVKKISVDIYLTCLHSRTVCIRTNIIIFCYYTSTMRLIKFYQNHFLFQSLTSSWPFNPQHYPNCICG